MDQARIALRLACWVCLTGIVPQPIPLQHAHANSRSILVDAI